MTQGTIKASGHCQAKVGGVYIHVPFCYRKCCYCDFYREIDFNSDRHARYVETVIKEIEWHHQHSPTSFKANSLYFGGGSPSILPIESIELIIRAIKESIPLNESAELSIECNSFDLTDAKVRAYEKAGINRISLGVQTLNSELQRKIGRVQQLDHLEKMLECISKQNFQSISLDFIFGIPDQTKKDIDQVFALVDRWKIPHFSFYSLTYGEQSELSRKLTKGHIARMGEEKEEQLYHHIVSSAKERGFTQYEISNFALEGHQSIHNLNYWLYNPYRGFGAGAHSFLRRSHEFVGKRFSAKESIEQYLKYEWDKDQSGAIYVEDLRGEDEALMEYVFLSLRRSTGLSILTCENIFNRVFTMKDCLTDALNKGLITFEYGVVACTSKGFWFHNSISLWTLESFHLR